MSLPIRKIALVEPRQPLPSIIPQELIVLPRYGVPLIATILRNQGYEVTLFVEDILPINWEIVYAADVVAFHALTCTLGEMERIVKQLRLKSTAPIIVGGEHASYLPENALRLADYVVRKEGDETIVDLLDALANGRDVETVAGITYRKNGQAFSTPDRPRVREFETVVDITTIYGWEEAYGKTGPPWPMMTVQTSRGCPFGCKFCPVDVVFGKGYYKRSVDSVIADLKDKRQYSRTIMFVDNLFGGDQKHAREILERIIAEKIRPNLTVFCRSSIGRRPEMLKLMKRAGVTRIFVGIESLDQASLDHASKGQSIGDVELAVQTIREHGISVHATMVMGFDTDTLASLQATRRMLGKFGISQINIFSLWGYYPDQKDRLTPIERMIFKDWAHLNGSYVCHFPLRIRPSILQREIIAAHDDTFCTEPLPGDVARWSGPEGPWRGLYEDIWQTIRPTMIEYIPFLEQIEQGYYDKNDNLLVEKLASRSDLDRVKRHLS